MMHGAHLLSIAQKMENKLSDYLIRSSSCVSQEVENAVGVLCTDLERARQEGRKVFICGNGGSAANALHWANDLLYGAAKSGLGGLKSIALSANQSVSTCLANDLGYESIFSAQLEVLAEKGDLLITLSGSGNSPNILSALCAGKKLGMKTWAIVGFDGGKAITLADQGIHFRAADMQVAEDLQMVVCHVVTRTLAGGIV
jgi:D-sedoheptulose 7-phosphate isomerase